jgi:hypothetical protein
MPALRAAVAAVALGCWRPQEPLLRAALGPCRAVAVAAAEVAERAQTAPRAAVAATGKSK